MNPKYALGAGFRHVIDDDPSSFFITLSGVAMEGDAEEPQYTVTTDLTDTDGHSIKGSYTGAIEFTDRSFSSTLTGVITFILAGMPCDRRGLRQLLRSWRRQMGSIHRHETG